jgi:hypothetical protein
VLSHYSAGAAYRLVRWDDRYPQVTIRGPGTRRHRGIRVHRTATLDPRDVTWHRGIPITTVARTLIDLASHLPYRALRRAVRQALALKLVELRELIATMHRLGPRRGAANLKRVVATAAPTRSVLEDVVLDLILGADLAKPDVNVPMLVSGRVLIPDFRWPAEALIVEADGRRWHDDPIARADDAERQALLEACGERVLRVTWEQAVSRPSQTVARIRSAGAPAA